MSKKPPFPPKTVLIVLFPDFQILDAAGPIAAFEIATRFAGDVYKLRFTSSEGGRIGASAGVAFDTESLKGLSFARIDTLITVGGMGTRAASQDTRLIAALKRAHGKVRRLASVCSGSFCLAAAGLLEGRKATTHWRQAPLMQRLYPNVRVEPDRIYVKEGAIWTSAGVSAGIDLALAMIAEDLGADIAKNVAREMVVYAQRPGGQAQHSTLLDLGGAEERFASLHAWMRAHLHQNLSVENLAAQAAMSPRNFTRAYVRETGVTPAKAVERLRLEAARAALESGASSIQDVARKAGFGDSERMRRAFIRFYGAPPAALKRTLRHA
ncbi:MAG TPA: GlxA family transcriptional regulator [Caulobacterales bacterium]|nr:GlxA family transcriptional regulator [Caulobacterales bacterium]